MKLRTEWLGLMISLLCSVAMWSYVQFVSIPIQIQAAEAKQWPRGNLSDLYPRWLGARELLLHGRDPYSAEVTHEIQRGYYGRELDPTRPNDPKDAEGFAYPLYVVVVLAPFVKLPFTAVQAGFSWFLILLMLGSVWCWQEVLRFPVSRMGQVSWFVIALGSFPFIQAYKLQQLSLLVFALLSLAAWLLTRNHLASAGVALAFAFIKPQLAVLLVGWLLLWAITKWRRRWRLVAGFSVTMILLLAASEWLLPGWFFRFQEAAQAYLVYTGTASPLEIWLGRTPGRIAAVLLLLAFARQLWRWRIAELDDSRFLLTWITLLALSVNVMPMVTLYNQLLLLPAGLWLWQWRSQSRASVAALPQGLTQGLAPKLAPKLALKLALGTASWATQGILGIALVAVIAEWVIAAGMVIAAAALGLAAVKPVWFLPLATCFVVPVAILAALWLAGREATLPSGSISSSGQ